jgi:hypothetical protein
MLLVMSRGIDLRLLLGLIFHVYKLPSTKAAFVTCNVIRIWIILNIRGTEATRSETIALTNLAMSKIGHAMSLSHANDEQYILLIR